MDRRLNDHLSSMSFRATFVPFSVLYLTRNAGRGVESYYDEKKNV